MMLIDYLLNDLNVLSLGYWGFCWLNICFVADNRN